MSDDIPDGQINMPPQPKSGFEAFRGTPPAIALGVVAALIITFALFYTGMYLSCCFFLGLVLVAVVLYYIPKLFGMEKLYQFVVLGVVFFLLMTALGTLWVSKDMVNKVTVADGENCGTNWYDVHYNVNDDKITIEYQGDKYKEGETNAFIYIKKIDKICYNNIIGSFTDADRHYADDTPVPTEKGRTFTFSGLNLEEDNLYVYEFFIGNLKQDGEKQVYDSYVTGSVSNLCIHNHNASDNKVQELCFNGNAYWVGICTAIFFVMLVLMHFMHKYLDQTRARMEAEGRLYPQGYGRCKECGTIVLPGETCCRKCGAYVDIPDDLRVKKVDSFKCSECGAEVPGDSVCCPRCGAKFDETDETVVVDKDGKENIITVENTATDIPQEENKQPEEEKKQ